MILRAIIAVMMLGLSHSLLAVNTDLSSLSQVETAASKKITKEKDHKLIVFWATWCTDCRKKLTTSLPKLAENADYDVITVNIDSSEKRVRAYLEKEKITLPVYRDQDNQLQQQLKVHSVPFWAYFKKQVKGWELIHSETGFKEDKIKSIAKADANKPKA